MGSLEFLFALLFAAVLLVRAADAVRVPYPIVLVLGGLGLAFVPGPPEIDLDPHAVLLIFLPPLLMSAGWGSSPRELRAEHKELGALAVSLVLVTMAAVALTAHSLVQGMPWPTAFVLGAVVAPTDAVSAVATFSTVRVPARVRRLVQGESMINDATGLTAFKVAAAAALTGTFAPEHAVLDFVRASVGGVVVGLAVAWLALRAVRRQPDVAVSIVLTVLSAYASYIAAERANFSGVLAAVACGVYAGWFQSEFFDADTRLSATAFWTTLVFGLETLLFVLLGLELPTVAEEFGHATTSRLGLDGIVVAVVVLGVRMLFALVRLTDALDLRERLVVGWCGMRGAISLAAALSLDRATPMRAEVIVLTFIVILVTLVGQGLSLPALVRVLNLSYEGEWSTDEAVARLETSRAALDRLDELEQEGRADPDTLRRMRELYRARARQCEAVLGGDPRAAIEDAQQLRLQYGALRRELIGAEREALLILRDDGRAGLGVLRAVERDLDLEEARLT